MRSTRPATSRPTIIDLWWPMVLPVALSLLTLGLVSAAVGVDRQ